MSDHDRWMQQALREAEDAFEAGERPVGAVVVRKDQIIGRGRSRVEQLNDPTAHAVLLAITAASETLGTSHLPDCTIYTTVEPCVMCAGAVVAAKAERLVFGAVDDATGAASTLYAIPRDDRLGHQASIVSGICADRASDLLDRFSPRDTPSG